MGTYAKHILSTCQKDDKEQVRKNSKKKKKKPGVHTITGQNKRWEVSELKVTQWGRWRWVEDGSTDFRVLPVKDISVRPSYVSSCSVCGCLL